MDYLYSSVALSSSVIHALGRHKVYAFDHVLHVRIVILGDVLNIWFVIRSWWFWACQNWDAIDFFYRWLASFFAGISNPRQGLFFY